MIFRQVRETVKDAAETAKRGINASLVVACVAIVIAVIALIVCAVRRG